MPRAERAQARPAPPRASQWLLKTLVFVLVCALPTWGSMRLLVAGQAWVAVVYAALSLLAFVLYWHDKRRARSHGQRIAEKLLHLSELCGGWPGALLAQQAFRHKTRKVSYQGVFWMIVLAHQAIWLEQWLRR